jgi:hypothetical protein
MKLIIAVIILLLHVQAVILIFSARIIEGSLLIIAVTYFDSKNEDLFEEDRKG